MCFIFVRMFAYSLVCGICILVHCKLCARTSFYVRMSFWRPYVHICIFVYFHIYMNACLGVQERQSTRAWARQKWIQKWIDIIISDANASKPNGCDLRPWPEKMLEGKAREGKEGKRPAAAAAVAGGRVLTTLLQELPWTHRKVNQPRTITGKNESADIEEKGELVEASPRKKHKAPVRGHTTERNSEKLPNLCIRTLVQLCAATSCTSAHLRAILRLSFGKPGDGEVARQENCRNTATTAHSHTHTNAHGQQWTRNKYIIHVFFIWTWQKYI